MSTTALNEYNEARIQQTTQNDARRIRTRVEAAKENPSRSGIRWPFELLQNAHDAGPREEDDRVEINFSLKGDTLSVTHTGKPFTFQELAAMLSGGSSKEFEEEATTGRFGTGFLVTHGLSRQITVKGVLSTPKRSECFCIELNRDGDEEAIKQNIKLAGQSLEIAEEVTELWIAKNPTVSFNYMGVNRDVACRGLERLQLALPYLYATCKKLGNVCIDWDEGRTVFLPGSSIVKELGNLSLSQTEVIISTQGNSQQLYAVRLCPRDGKSALLTVVERLDNQLHLKLCESDFPKLFVTFPLTDTGFLPFNVVLDGQFTTQQERDGILMNKNDRDLISTALSCLPELVRHAVESGWSDAHLLAQLAVPNRMLGGENDNEELEWWAKLIQEVAQATASEHIIETAAGRLPALHENGLDAATFLDTSFDVQDSEGGAKHFDYDRIHELAIAVGGLYIPNLDVAQDWAAITRDWDKAGVSVERMGFRQFAQWLKKRSKSIKDLPLSEDSFVWLARFLNLAGKLSKTWTMEDVINELIPDQHSKLCPIGKLRVDGGISEEVKDIAESIELDLRSQILHQKLAVELARPGYESAKSLVDQLTRDHFKESEACDAILEKLEAALPDRKEYLQDEDATWLCAASRLATFLGEQGDIQRLRNCPLLTEGGKIIRLQGHKIMAPVIHWPQSSQKYRNLYTEKRLLSNLYSDDLRHCHALQPLIEGGLVIQAPLHHTVRSTPEDRDLLFSVAVDNIAEEHIAIENVSMEEIAFLSSDLVQRCGNDEAIAKLLLEFVLNVAAGESQNWRGIQQIDCSRAGETLQMNFKEALWPTELQLLPWVPVRISEEDNKEHFTGGLVSEATLKKILNPTWLTDNRDAVEFLHEIFGFSLLTLTLESLNLDPEEKEDTESYLVELLHDRDLLRVAAENLESVRMISRFKPSEIQELIHQLEERKRQKRIQESNRDFGYAVQDALKQAIEAYGPELKLIDLGYDYEVLPGVLGGELERAIFSFKVGNYFLEVKATSTGDVRLTPRQAEKASNFPNRFVLCVVDLRGQETKQSWSPCKVEPFARIVTSVGPAVSEVFCEVNALTKETQSPVRLRNEKELRYGLTMNLWGKGKSIREWVQTLKADLTPNKAVASQH